MKPLPMKGTIMQFADVVNPFGTDAFTAPASEPATYYKGMRLENRPKVKRSAPKPPSTIIKNFLLNFNG